MEYDRVIAGKKQQEGKDRVREGKQGKKGNNMIASSRGKSNRQGKIGKHRGLAWQREEWSVGGSEIDDGGKKWGKRGKRKKGKRKKGKRKKGKKSLCSVERRLERLLL